MSTSSHETQSTTGLNIVQFFKWFWRLPIFLMLMLLALGYHQFSPPKCFIGDCIEGATVANMTIGAIGLLVNCIIISTLTVVLSVPVATRRIQIVFLIWLVTVLYSNSNLGPA